MKSITIFFIVATTIIAIQGYYLFRDPPVPSPK